MQPQTHWQRTDRGLVTEAIAAGLLMCEASLEEDASVRILVDHSGYALMNIGDVAMLQACVRRLKSLWPNAEIQAFTESPERLERYCPGVTAVVPTVAGGRVTSVAPMSFQLAAEQMWKITMPLLARSKHRLPSVGQRAQQLRVLEAVRYADLVVSAGGGFVNDVFWWHGSSILSVMAMAQRLGKPTAMFGQGIGPLTNPLLTRLVAHTMPRLLVIGLREGLVSVPLLRAHRVEQNRTEVTGDDALLLATAPHRPITGAAIGVNVRVAPYSGVETNVAGRAVAVVCESARRRGAMALALPVSRYKAHCDIDAIRQASGADRKADPARHDFADIHTPEDLAERASHCRVVVTGSYHAAVFGLAAGVPAVCISNSAYYDLKFEGLRAQFPGGCQLVRPGPSFERELSEAIDRAWETNETGRDSIHSAALAQVAKADALYGRLKSLLSPTISQSNTHQTTLSGGHTPC